jgi:hypothetical protein
MNIICQLLPGSAIKAKGQWPWPDHLGIVGRSLWDGTLTVIDSTEHGVNVRTMEQFALGRELELQWVPQTIGQQNAALERAYSQIGRPYDLFHANCEHFVHWVVTGEIKSPQLRSYFAVAGLLGLAALAVHQPGKR